MKEDNERIRKRIADDDEMFSDAFVSLSDAVTDRALFYLLSEHKSNLLDDAAKEILSYYGIKEHIRIPDSVTDPFERLDMYLMQSGFMKRMVSLPEKWYRDAAGVYIGILDGSKPVALYRRFRKYYFKDPSNGKKTAVTGKNCGRIGSQALCIYAPLPRREITVKDIFRYLFSTLYGSEILKILVFTVMVTLGSMLVPEITRYIFEEVALQTEIRPLLAVFLLLCMSRLAVLILETGRDLVISDIESKMESRLRSGVIMRMLELPADTLRKYQTGEIYSAASGAGGICAGLPWAILSAVPAAASSLIYLLQIRSFAVSLVIPALSVTLILAFLSAAAAFYGRADSEKMYAAQTRETSFLMSMIGGIQKIRITGAEKRVFAKWAECYGERTRIQYRPPFLIRYKPVIRTLIVAGGAGVIYYTSINSGISPAAYLAFNASYGLLTGVFSQLVDAVDKLSRIPSELRMLSPLLSVEPEETGTGNFAGEISGKIDVNNISFRYGRNLPYVLKDFSLSVKPGEYLGIVGKSGCGKTTLMRLLLGFEKLSVGSISYDEKDIRTLDLRSLRKNIGCVLQDSGLFTGTIRDNVAVTDPDASDEKVWNAIRMAGMDGDVRKMPMKLETMVSDDTGTISGGQKQRILIARALLTEPRILFFDEATSALDNNTQKAVLDSLAKLKCTRVTVAHRLSTVKDCDRIILIEEGKIAEEGTYEELLEKNGKFAALIKRQLK